MTVLAWLAAASVGVCTASIARLLRPPPRRLAGRVRPYTLVARSALGAPADVLELAVTRPGATVPRLFGPPLVAAARRAGRVLEARSDEHLGRLLAQAGLAGVTPDDYRVRQLAHGAALAALAGLAAGVTLGRPLVTLASVLAGFTFGTTRWRRRVERAVETRCEQLRRELYTVNQLLAIHIRTGAGPIQAVQRVVDRGRGAVVEELDEVLLATRRGLSEPEAFRRAAENTPEPAAARTYHVFATGSERGADLATALLALSEDLRDARREELHQTAVKRRAAMLIPTIAVLAPIMLLFIAAPLPSIVLGRR